MLAAVKLAQLCKTDKLDRFVKYIDVQPESVLWTCCCVLLPFVCINVYYDLSTYKQHLKLSLI